MNTTGHSEGINSFFDGFVTSTTNLKEFVFKYELALKKIMERESNEDFESEHKYRIVNDGELVLKCAAQFYNRKVFNKFKDEWDQVCRYKVEEIECDNEYHSFSVRTKYGELKEFAVKFNMQTYKGIKELNIEPMRIKGQLDLSGNAYIGGRLPRNLGKLCNLQTLKLSRNSITGEVTDFINVLSECTNSSLMSLELGYNKLIGNLPISLGYLNNLRYLNLRYNSFQGSIPPSIGNLSSLEEFYLSGNQMNGMPESLGQLSALKVLDLSENLWEGVITEAHFMNLSSLKELSFYKLSPNISLVFNINSDWIAPFKLRYINIRSCQLGPKFPTWVKNQNELNTVVLNNARISDTIPDWFLQLDLKLQELDVAYNNLSGKVPNSISFLNPSTVDLSSNCFEGRLPLWSSNVTKLYLRSNVFSGPIPGNFGVAMPFLMDLDISWNSLNDMSYNNLSGSIPKSIGSLSSVMFLILSNNNLSGELPPSLQNCTSMDSLDLGDNKLSGNLPAWIGESMPSLSILRLRSNFFGGNIPSQICILSTLHILDLSHNNLSGFIPPCLGNLSRLEVKPSETEKYEGRILGVSDFTLFPIDW
ncbi:hypothetical protein LWI28_011471 [Acer negundo]|uniref:Disease resistance R13L4/SHOC-2-like LRR domain-containing protein n=1 Tax=Acer negundo TaxID=4023 RepID=A0AAD5NRW3_ACENE|nr:hypothetical protein LWI28_011471 [Acer negundo]